jgi:hypothetical protein
MLGLEVFIPSVQSGWCALQHRVDYQTKMAHGPDVIIFGLRIQYFDNQVVLEYNCSPTVHNSVLPIVLRVALTTTAVPEYFDKCIVKAVTEYIKG